MASLITPGGGGGGGVIWINLGFMDNRVQAVSLIRPRKGLQYIIISSPPNFPHDICKRGIGVAPECQEVGLIIKMNGKEVHIDVIASLSGSTLQFLNRGTQDVATEW